MFSICMCLPFSVGMDCSFQLRMQCNAAEGEKIHIHIHIDMGPPKQGMLVLCCDVDCAVHATTSEIL